MKLMQRKLWPLRSIILIPNQIYNTGYKIGCLLNPSSLLSGRTSYVEAPLSVCRLLTVFCVVFVRLDRETTPNYTTEEGGGRKEGRKEGREANCSATVTDSFVRPSSLTALP